MAGNVIKPSFCSGTTVPMYKTATDSIPEKHRPSTKFRVTLLFRAYPLFSMA